MLAELPCVEAIQRMKSVRLNNPMRIAIIGLGYVGLPLCLQFAKSGAEVLGLDIDDKKVNACNKGETYIKHISSESIQEQLDAKRFSASTDFAKVKDMDAAVICVPTPLNKNREPDISYILATGKAIAPHIQKGLLVVFLEADLYRVLPGFLVRVQWRRAAKV